MSSSDFVVLYIARTYFDGIDLTVDPVTLSLGDGKLRIHQGGEVVGSFYDHYEFTPGMSAAVGDEQFDIVIEKEGPFSNRTQPVKISFFISKAALLRMLQSDEEAPLLVRCLRQTFERPERVRYRVARAENVGGADELTSSDQRLLGYQRQNVAWLVAKDSSIRTGVLSTTYLPHNYPSLRLEDETEIFFSPGGRILSADRLPTPGEAQCSGLLFSDRVGVGKTACVAGALRILQKRGEAKDGTLLIVPGKVASQWREELTGIGVAYVLCKRGLRKYLAASEKPGTVLFTFNFLKNPAYLESPIRDVRWSRIVIDECHELSARTSYSKPEKQKRESIGRILERRTGPLWLVSATPRGQARTDFEKMVRWMYRASDEVSLPSDFYVQALKENSRRTSKDDVSRCVNIPSPTYEDVSVSMTWAEHVLYTGERSDERMIEMCSHPVCSKFYQKLMTEGNPQDLDSYVKRSIEYLERSIPRLRKLTGRLRKQYEETVQMHSCDTRWGKSEEAALRARLRGLLGKEDELRDSEYRLRVVSELEQVARSGECCICYGDLEELSLPKCGHAVCLSCYGRLEASTNICPICRSTLEGAARITLARKEHDPEMERRNKWGSKTAKAVELVHELLQDPTRRVIVFSRWSKVLKHLERALKEADVCSRCVSLKGTVHHMAASLARFRHDPRYRIALLSAQVCSSGVNLTETTDILLFDSLHREPRASREMEAQAVGRAVRIGQKTNVRVRRLVAVGTIEEEFLVSARRS